MDKRQKSILVWVLVWAGLLLVVLYSPIGSPDLYSNRQYFSANQGVVFDGAVIENAPSVSSSSGNNSSSSSDPSFELTGIGNNSYSASSSTSNDVNQGFGGGGSMNSGLESRQIKGGSSFGGGFGFGGSTNSKNSKGNTSGQVFGASSLGTDLTMLGENNSTKQSVGYTPGSGGTDPGDDPNGPPIPVGDGWFVMLVFSIVFAIWKNYKQKPLSVHK